MEKYAPKLASDEEYLCDGFLSQEMLGREVLYTNWNSPTQFRVHLKQSNAQIARGANMGRVAETFGGKFLFFSRFSPKTFALFLLIILSPEIYGYLDYKYFKIIFK